MFEYPAKFEYYTDDGNYYVVEFPDLPGCITQGESIDECLQNAKEALSGYLESVFERNIKIPKPSDIKGDNIYYIRPEKNVVFALELREQRLKKGLSQQEIANKLKIKYQTYQRFENPAKSNPTLKTISKIEMVLGENLIAI